MKEKDLNKFNFKRLDYLFEKKVIVYSMALIGAGVLAWSYKSPTNSPWLIAWLTIYATTTIARFILIKIYNEKKENFSPLVWEITYTAFTSLIGLLWAMSGVFLLAEGDTNFNFTSIFLICGIASGSLLGNASSRMSTVSMLSTILLPSAFLYYRADFTSSSTLAALFILYWLGLVLTSVKLNQFITDNIKLQLTNTSLIEDLKKSSQKLNETEKQAINSSKLAAIGEMASGIAHEINNPLAILSGNLRNIDRTLGKPDYHQKISAMTEKCHSSIQRITKIIRGLKKMSRDGVNDDFQHITVKSIYEDIESLIHERFRVGGIAFHLHNECPDELIFCQPVQISQILLNLLNNAYHAVEDKSAQWVKLTADLSEGEVILRVLDSGLGIAKEDEDKIFTPFFTTKEVGKGTGLGLSISRDIAQKHEGKLFIDYEHKNTCFTLTLPVKKLAA
ncbi:hypothetical protein A9Q84_03840 [Halobacteriovorax marinus]|uniref:histidine kinase n=1 Tax=Halobacteriovorax marinus TaxID=97084 RepID=A0A1Y5FEF0_9BACT|nr:hypothetical protein A9Q84_03840 [Halobacteriovorax marinus]